MAKHKLPKLCRDWPYCRWLSWPFALSCFRYLSAGFERSSKERKWNGSSQKSFTVPFEADWSWTNECLDCHIIFVLILFRFHEILRMNLWLQSWMLENDRMCRWWWDAGNSHPFPCQITVVLNGPDGLPEFLVSVVPRQKSSRRV